MYFGLQAGIVNAMPMQSALLGFALFRSVQHRLAKPLSPSELTTIELVAGAVGLAPFTSGFTGIIPALEFIATPTQTGSIVFSTSQLLVWCLATCALGILVAAPFRRLFILRDRLLYPSATATGTLIGVLFRDEAIISRAKQPRTACLTRSYHNRRNSAPPSQLSQTFHHGDISPAIRILVVSLCCSSAFSLVSYFIPILKDVPLFGHHLANQWLWTYDLSPAYIGYGMIIGPTICMYTLIGAVIGWGFLSPIASHHGWVSGPVDNWETGSRGWILWVGMGLTLGDSAVGLVWITIKPLVAFAQHHVANRQGHISSDALSDERMPLFDHQQDPPPTLATDESIQDDAWPTGSLATTRLLTLTGVGLVSFYLLSTLLVLREYVTVRATVVSLLLMPLGGFISMRALGETDNGASLAIARLAQFLIGLIIPASSMAHISANLLLGGAVEAASSQASQHMGGLKTAHMTKTAPRIVFYCQIIGSFVGTIVATTIYRLYTSVNAIPSRDLGIPDAHVWLVAVKLMYQQGLPPMAFAFSSASFALGASFGVVRIVANSYWWGDYAPSGVAIAVGKHLCPSNPIQQNATANQLQTVFIMVIVDLDVIGSDNNFWLYSKKGGYDITHPPTPGAKGIYPRIRVQSTTGTVELDPAKAALVVIDLQNYFLSPALGRPTDSLGLKLVDKLLKHTIPACRKAGIPVLWIRWGLTEEDLSTMPPTIYKGFAADTNFDEKRKKVKTLKPGSLIGEVDYDGGRIEAGRVLMQEDWNAKLYEPLEKVVEPQDMRVCKNRLSAFWGGTEVEKTLEERGIKTLLFAGANLDHSGTGMVFEA
ncbi:hypothetical protein PG985_014679 [Apiospora marii]|uniref:Isochorismatase-like domain-containing protein n=1 Tax=Apiospora marii TaxID=335849 RepID=A0ABR1R515_9PEZI